MLFDLVVQIHYMHDIQKLTLILMQTLNLYVKDGARIYFDAVVLQDIVCKADLVLILDVHELSLCLLVVCINGEAFILGKVCNPIFTNMSSHPVSQKRIAVQQEAALCDTVCLVGEFLRHHLIEITQLALFQNLCVQCGNTVDRITADDRQICHADHAVVDNCHGADLLFAVLRIMLADLIAEAAVDLFDDLVNTRKQA